MRIANSISFLWIWMKLPTSTVMNVYGLIGYVDLPVLPVLPDNQSHASWKIKFEMQFWISLMKKLTFSMLKLSTINCYSHFPKLTKERIHESTISNKHPTKLRKTLCCLAWSRLKLRYLWTCFQNTISTHLRFRETTQQNMPNDQYRKRRRVVCVVMVTTIGHTRPANE